MFGFFRKKPTDREPSSKPSTDPSTANDASDYSAVDSLEKAQALHRAGKLEKLFLRPLELGGPDEPMNTLYAPASAVARKSRIDLEVIQPLAAEGRIRSYAANVEYQGKSVIPSAVTIEVSDPETYRFTVPVWGDALSRQERQWDEVYSRREALYAHWFGPISGDVQKLMNLIGVWPGGCLVQIQSPKHKLWVTSSFGLTNADMPATTLNEQFAAEDSADGTSTKYSMRLVARPPQPIPLGRAGYGYEILLFTPQPPQWPLMFLDWSVQAEILQDIDLLGRIKKYGALTVESISLGDQSGDFLIAPLHNFAPGKADLPNGTMELLAATLVTRAQMEFGRKHGGPALLKQILARPELQASPTNP